MVDNYRDATRKMDEAYETAAFKVVVEQLLVTTRVYQLSNAYFQERVNEFLQTNQRLNKFVRFYTPQSHRQEGETRPRGHAIRRLRVGPNAGGTKHRGSDQQGQREKGQFSGEYTWVPE